MSEGRARPRIALLGDHQPEALTHREIDVTVRLASNAAAMAWVPTDSRLAHDLSGFDGVWVTPGTPYRCEPAVHAAIGYAREHGQPLLGTCGGFQHLVLEYARNVAGLEEATHAETDPRTGRMAIGPLTCSLVGQERMVCCVRGTRLADLCGGVPFRGFHWCNYGLAADVIGDLVARGLVISAYADDAGVEAVELRNHPFFLATLFQPQVGASGAAEPHPIIGGLIRAASDRASKSRRSSSRETVDQSSA